VVSLLIGGAQCVLGGLASIFAYLIYASQQVQEMLSVGTREVSLFMFLLLIFGMLSIMSGLLLVWGRNGSY
jgi:uncharacterized protein with PQ loop repeat